MKYSAAYKRLRKINPAWPARIELCIGRELRVLADVENDRGATMRMGEIGT